MNRTLKALFCFLLIIASAYVSVTLPISEQGIPFTAQSLVVFIVAAFLRPVLFLIVISSYLLLGGLGLPVFAEGSSGWAKLLGPSGGFLIGFLFSGLFISLGIYNRKLSFARALITMIIATLILFIFGIGVLAFKFGFQKALEYGLYPFWIMALVKAFLATFCVFAVLRRSQ